jgi:predicted PurR-regulated permease PerM
MKEKNFFKYIALVIIILLAIFIIYYMWKYINGFFGALILFTLFLPLYKYLIKNNINKNLSAIIIIIITLIIVIIPSYFILNSSYQYIVDTVNNQDNIINELSKLEDKFNINLTNKVKENLNSLANWSGNILIRGLNSIVRTGITLTIMYFLLFYLLINHDKIKHYLKEYLPFNQANSNKLYSEFKNVTYATVFSAGLLSVFQGLLLGLGFWFFGIKAAVLWGLLAAIFSFLPIVGVPVIWIPYAIYYFLIKNYYVAIGLIIWGLIINYSEYIIRPSLQKKIGDLHPLISIIGIFLGLSAFGIVGIVIGPLLISYFILTFKMFKEEYLT